MPSRPSSHPRFSVFDARTRPANDPDQWVGCPIYPCRYEVPVDLEDVARERHRHAHTVEEWAAVAEGLKERKASAREHYLRETEDVDADLRRLKLWSGQDA